MSQAQRIEELEQALANSQQQHRDVVDHLQQVVFQTDVDGRWTSLNRAWTQVTGFRPEESIGTNFLDYVHPDDQARNRQLLVPLMARTIDECRHQVRYITAKGPPRWVEVHARLILDKEDRITGITGTLTDVSEKHDVQSALRESRYMLQTILDAAPVRVYWKGTDLRYKGANKAFLKDVALPNISHLIGKTDADLRWNAQAALMEDEDQQILNNGCPQIREQEARSIGPGDPRWLHIRRVPLKNARNEAIGVLGTYVDITAQLHGLKELHAQQRMESVAMLAGGLAHDFNNLLTCILGNASLAQQILDDPAEVSACLDDTILAANQARELAQKLLTFSEGGEPVRRATSASELVTDAVRMALSGTAVRARWKIEEGLPPVDVDWDQVRGAIRSLAQNAVQAMENGGDLTVSVSLHGLTDANPLHLSRGDYICVEFVDTGVGIATEHLPRIFEPFYTTRPKQSGLGLATAYSVMTKHGGAISVDSAEGKGSRFVLWLPAGSYSDQEQGPDNVRTSLRGHGRVLVMDDEPYIRTLSSKFLRRFGFEVETVPDGDTALRVLQKAMAAGEPFEFAILDLTIPGGVGGVETLRRLRTVEPTLRAVVSSGYSDDPVLANPAAYGFDAVLPKPYTVEHIVDALRPLVP